MFFQLTRNDISPALARMIKEVRPPNRRRILRAMGTTFKSITEGTFNSVGAGYRPHPWPVKRDGQPSILQKSTTLAKSFFLEVTDNQATVSNPTKYAAIHQFGGTIRAKPGRVLTWIGPDGKRIFRKSVKIPARPFFPVVNGKLTPAAETKIAEAARRMLRKIMEPVS